MLWEDVWYQDCALKTKFSRLYQLTKWQHLEVSMFLDIWGCYDHIGEAFWNLKLRGWEVYEVMELESILKTMKLNSKVDELIWKPGNATFTSRLGIE